MITEQYVSFKTSKLLKENGFDICCQMLYLDDKHPFLTDRIDDCGNYYKNSELAYDEYSAPTQALTMCWLREEKEIIIIILHGCKAPVDNGWCIAIQQKGNNDLLEQTYVSYEEAVEAAIIYCLENLICRFVDFP